ncbi:MAG TPA: glutamate racemase [Deinococcales bacterium]|nr:glutamate racemase [Deinococcales bacterium]
MAAVVPPNFERPIGVFDSGVGGLTVLKALRAALPGEDFIYLGDTARVPYGRKPPEMVRAFSAQIGSFLVDEGVKALVVACNTASSVALGTLAALPIPVWGVLEPGVSAARAASRGGIIGVVGTRATVNSGAYQSRLASSGLQVWARACPMFVPLVEEGLSDSDEARLMAEYYLRDRPPLDALILGCTHYPVLSRVLSEVLGPDVPLVDSAQATAGVVEKGLKTYGLLNRRPHEGTVVHYVTGDPASYRHTAGVIGGVEGETRFLHVDRLSERTDHARP